MSKKINIAFFFGILLYLVPLWIFPIFPTQDGPSHLAGANILKEYNSEDAPIFREFYTIPKEPVPNWIGHVVLAIFLNWMSPEIAEKVLLSGYVILLPLMFRYVLEKINPDATLLAFLSFPFIYNYLFHMGFYNFVWGLPLFFLLIGTWIRVRDNLTSLNVFVLSALAIALYFCHIFSFALSAVTLGIIEIWLTGFDLAHKDVRGEGNIFVEFFEDLFPRAVFAIIAYLPGIVLAVFFVLQRNTVQIPSSTSLFNELNMLGSLNSLVSFDWNEVLVTRVIAGCLYLSAAIFMWYKFKQRNIERYDGFIFVGLIFVILYFTFPETELVSENGLSGGGFVKSRIGIFPMFFLILWMAAQRVLPRLNVGVVAIVIVCSAVHLGMNTKKYSEFSEYLQEYRSAIGLIEPNTSVLPISFSSFDSDWQGHPKFLKVDPFRHAPEIFSAQKNVVVLSHYEGNMGYFPTNFRPHKNPFRAFGKLPRDLNEMDIMKYQESSAGHPNYVLLWMPPPKDSPSWKSLPLHQVKQHYDLIYTSRPRGFMHLYRKKEIGI